MQWILEQDMKRPELLDLSEGRLVYFSAACPGRETPNEDSAAIVRLDDGSLVLIVADGMGGGLAGEQASALAVRAVVRELEPTAGREPQELRASILNGMERANVEVQALGLGAATTLAVVELREQMVRPYHVGDSLVLVVGNRGRVKLQTIAHSPVGYAVEAGLLDATEAMHHEERHVVSNMVGSPDMRIELGAPMRLARRDTLLLASDGLVDNLHVEELVELIRKGPLVGAMEVVADRARRRMLAPAESERPSKPDDLTFIALRRSA